MDRPSFANDSGELAAIPLAERSVSDDGPVGGGACAKAVNEGRSEELVWVGTDQIDLEHWYDRLLVRRPYLEVQGLSDHGSWWIAT